MHDIPRRVVHGRALARALDTDFLLRFRVLFAQRSRHRSRTASCANRHLVTVRRHPGGRVQHGEIVGDARSPARRPWAALRIEVARLQLGNIDPRSDRIILRGKASREGGIPLPADVGQAANGGPVDSAWFLCASSCRSRCQDNHLPPKVQERCTRRLLRFIESSPGSGQRINTDTECSSGMVRRRPGVTGFSVESRSLLCTYCLFALETSVGHLRRSDLPPRTALGFRFRTSEHPALGPAH